MTPAAANLKSGVAGLRRNSAWNLVGGGLPLVAVVLFVPYLLRDLGNERFGLLSLILALLAYANALNLGLGKAVTRRVSQAIVQGQRDEVISGSAWAATVAQLVFGALGAAVLFIAARPIVDAMSFAHPEVGEAVASLRLLGVAVPIILVSTTFRGLLEAAERFDLINFIEAPVGLCQFSLPALAVFLGHGVTMIVVLLLLCQCTVLLSFVILAARLFPELRARPTLPFARLADLISFGGWVAISDLVFPIFTYVDRFLVAAFAGVGRLPAYVIPHEMINRLWLVPSSLTDAVFPVVTAIDRSTDPTSLRALYGRAMRMMVFAVLPVAALLTLFAKDVIALWISHPFANQAAPLVRIFALGLVINSMAMLGSNIIQGQGFPRQRVAIHLVEIPAYLLSAWILIPRYGLDGAAWAWVIRMAVTAVSVQALLRHKLSLGASALIDHDVHLVAIPCFTFLGVCIWAAIDLGLEARIGSACVGLVVILLTGVWVNRRAKSESSLNRRREDAVATAAMDEA